MSGGDSALFLQSITTNDISGISDKSLIYTFFLNAQGRFLFDAFIFQINNDIYIELDRDNLEKFEKRINFIKLKADVKLSRADELFALYSRDQMNIGYSFKDPRDDRLGYRSYVTEQLSGEDSSLYQNDKYKYIIPDGFIDLEYEKTLLPEFDPEGLNAISYTKGCYTGQEVMSRAKYQGVLRKSLYLLEIYDKIPGGSEVRINDSKAGYITSSYNGKAIALLKDEFIDAIPKEAKINENSSGKIIDVRRE